MASLRTFLRTHRALAALVLAVALCMKALMPAGFMVSSTSQAFTVQVCDDLTGHVVFKQLRIPMKGTAGESTAGAHDHKGTCPYSSLAMGGLSTVDPVLLASAIAFVMALGFVASVPVLPAPFSHIRPPLRGPPGTV